ncbi:MAG TPA: NAD(P)H-hydrate dehydratase [Phaeodactylibacter sp.]|nr:NAD(P)H-hydrate dehydratase [Phaeodactylibacter sp.]
MKILTAQQIRECDAYTIQHEPILSIDLMERASSVFVNWFLRKKMSTSLPIYIFCGKGNNGGDGLAIARLLQQEFYSVEVFICEIGRTSSPDFSTNLKRLPSFQGIKVNKIKENNTFPKLEKKGILIDAIFGSGLNRSVEGYWGQLLEHLNQQNQTIIAVDIPSGVFANQPTNGISIHADFTFSFEVPKLAFLFPENENRVGEWSVGSIRLHPDFLEKIKTPYFFLQKNNVKSILKKRKKYAHKGNFGHALLIVGSYGKVGAAILATRAALKTGAGLVTTHAPKLAYPLLQTTVPEAMVSIDENEFYFSKINDWEKYDAIGIGCGIGTETVTETALGIFLEKINQPIVLDADALNLISKNKKWLEWIPPNSILTPHPKEFERLFGKTKNSFNRNEVQRYFSKKHNIYIILKGAHTCISTPDGNCFFNSTGNPGMATAGSGDVLTGILTSLLSQGYNSLETSKLGVYLHGLAGDVALNENVTQESLIASDLIENIGRAGGTLRSS